MIFWGLFLHLMHVGVYYWIFLNTDVLSVYQGGLVDAVVPFMGESITDGTLANFLKRMSF
jgi:hypothetical protein